MEKKCRFSLENGVFIAEVLLQAERREPSGICFIGRIAPLLPLKDRCLPKFTNPAKLPQLGPPAIVGNLEPSPAPLTKPRLPYLAGCEMARRSRSRRRNLNYISHIVRVIAIIVIGLVVYRFISPSKKVPVAADQAEIDVLTSSGTSVESGTGVLSASATTDKPEKPSRWTFASLLGFGDSEEPASTTTSQTTGDVKPQTIAATSSQNVQSGDARFAPATGKRNPFAKVSNPTIEKQAFATTGQVPSDGRTAAQIISATRAAYQKLSSYSDQGKIALNYRLKGELIAEQQPFSTTWDARNNFYAGKLFSTEVLCDGKLLSCFMYHIDTENFGNQQLVIPVQTARSTPPVGQLLNDQFARNFIAGTENLPLAVPQSASQMFAMPPALAMLSDQVSLPWLGSNTQLQRKPDQKIGNVNCYVLDAIPARATKDAATLWIDQSTLLVKQIKFPNTLVVSKILASPDVTDIELVATFPNQKLGTALPAQQFTVTRYKNAQPVKKFIRLPDSLVSDSIGKSASIARFINRNGDRVGVRDFKTKVNTIVWLGDQRNLPLVDQLAEFKKTSPESFGFHAVFSGDLADLRTEVPQPVPALRQKERLGIPLLFDDGSALEALQLKSMPAMLVLGPDGRVQFSQNMSEPNWPQSLKTVLQRLANGEDIAKEMLNDYRVHYQQYGDELERYSAASYFANSVKPVIAKIDRGQRDTSIKLMPNKKWEQRDFAMPGNIIVLSNRAGQPFAGARYAAFDGRQTLRFIDSRGVATGKVVLEIPGNPAIAVLRYNPAGEGSFVGFERMGAQVHVFDSQMQLQRSFPSLDQKHSGILDCQPVPRADGKFFISFNDNNGVYLFDSNTGEPERISDRVVSALANGSGGSQLIGVVDGQLFDINAREEIGDLADKQVHQLLPSNTSSGDYAVTVRGGDNKWAAVGLSDQLRRIWSVDLRSQLLENPVEPIAVGQNSAGETFWAVIDDQNTVCLISGRGTWLGDWKSKSPIRCLAIATSGREVDLIVSTEDSVVAWALNYQAR